jgi:hypothetical protein
MLSRNGGNNCRQREFIIDVRQAVQMNYEAWLIGRKVDASKKVFVATGIIALDFELFIGARVQKLSAHYSKVSHTAMPLEPQLFQAFSNIQTAKARATCIFFTFLCNIFPVSRSVCRI